MTQVLLTIGSRGSPLALAQSKITRQLLAAKLNLSEAQAEQQLPIRTFTTSGDTLQDRCLVDAGGKGLFTKELELALATGEIDLAVHSMKDVPTQLPDGLRLAGMLPREDPREALIAGSVANISDLPKNPIIGTASVRRQAQILHLRPDAKIVLLRGNVGTRLRRLAEGKFDATFLALAGLNRLGQSDAASGIIETSQMLPSPAQGAVGLQIRDGDDKTFDMTQGICCQQTQIELTIERAFLTVLDGSCRTPIAALAQLSGFELSFTGEVYLPDGSQKWQRKIKQTLPKTAPLAALLPIAASLGETAGRSITDEAGDLVRFDKP
ncbi:Porphobilinogen deaminase [hydrothermal vent metagenome]|uniref:hydroxymethylbilane synthase n=1 Tax=hydrothermal vent metagenome TaxID=652676 RepID=A0A3B0SGL6_9ZZZZ